MFSTKHYVPILKWKLGEYTALAELNQDSRSKLTPLIEIPQIPYDHINEVPARTIDQHLEKVIVQIKNSWDVKRALFLDLVRIYASERMNSGEHPLIFLAENARQEKIKIIPVVGLERDEDYKSKTKEINQQDKEGICLRIDSEYFGHTNLGDELNDLMQFLEIGPKECDLILDLESIISDRETILINLLIMTINNFPFISDWRTFTLTATAFPQDLSSIPSRSITPLRRTEWHIWNSLIRSELIRKPTFSDYAIAHPEIIEIDPRIMTMSANIRYTVEDEWLIFKGHSVKREPGFEQFHDLAKSLIDHRDFSGRDFSWGDSYIEQCANRTVSSGNATTWRKVGTNHHLALLTKQVSDLAISDET